VHSRTTKKPISPIQVSVRAIIFVAIAPDALEFALLTDSRRKTRLAGQD
jgi:hypothetical protein